MSFERLLDDVLQGITRFEKTPLTVALRHHPRVGVREILVVSEKGRSDEISMHLRGGHFAPQRVETFERAREELSKRRCLALILDTRHSYSKALEFLDQTIRLYPGIPCVALMNRRDPEGMIEAFRAGAADVVAQVDADEQLVPALDRILDRQSAVRQSYLQEVRFDKLIEQTTPELRQHIEALRKEASSLSLAYRDVVARLCRASHWRDDETGDHIQRIGQFSREVGRKLGFSEAEVDMLGEASKLHDIGKIGVPDKILLKPGRLTEVEFEWMKSHTLIGAEILSGSRDPLLQAAEAIAVSHHEWYNGQGYPYGIKNEEIPIYGKIVTVVDVYDAMLHRRSYKRPVPLDETIDSMRRARGIQFDPEVFDAFLDCVEHLVRIESEMLTSQRDETKYKIRFGIHGMTKFLEESMPKV